MTNPTSPKRIGRPPKQIPANAAEIVKTMAAEGYGIVAIADRFRISKELLRQWFERDPALQEALDVGREQERRALHNMLYKDAMENGNATAAMFLLKSRHGYREGAEVDQSSGVRITFNLPGAMSIEDFSKGVTIENGK